MRHGRTTPLLPSGPEDGENPLRAVASLDCDALECLPRAGTANFCSLFFPKIGLLCLLLLFYVILPGLGVNFNELAAENA